jgi:hypothetical protein
LNFSTPPGLIILEKLSKRLATTIILCLLGFAILSNRFYTLRQFTARFNQNASFYLPVDNPTPSQTDRRTFLIALPNEGVSDVQQLSRDSLEIKPIPAGALGNSRILFGFHANVCVRPPAYILQSVLNL